MRSGSDGWSASGGALCSLLACLVLTGLLAAPSEQSEGNVELVSRDGWNAREPDFEELVDPADRTGVAVHHSAGPPEQEVESIQDYHMDDRDWRDIGYNFLVRQGEIYEGRGWDVKGAHAAPHNTTHLGFCWVGDSRYDTPTMADEQAMTSLIREAEDRFGPLSVDGHGRLPGQATECPGDFWRSWIEERQWESSVFDSVTFDVAPTPADVTFQDGTVTFLFTSQTPDQDDPGGKDRPKEPGPQNPDSDIPERPDDDKFEPGSVHPSFELMGERFQEWLPEGEISHDGDGYQVGAMYSEWDDFNVRKIQALMSNSVDPAGKAYLGPKQWRRLFTEERPTQASLPPELRGSVPPQLREPKDPKPKQQAPPRPKPEEFVPGEKHPSVTLMGERFLAWLKPDEIHYAGSKYEPGPRYSVYDDRNVRAIQALMDNEVDPPGEEFLGEKQWELLFTEGRPEGASVPDRLKPDGKDSNANAKDIPVEGNRITQHFGNPGDYNAGKHTGVDFGDSGSDAVRSVGRGKVVVADNSGAWGNRVIVKHNNGRWSWYTHLRAIDVDAGARVNRGTRLGLMGNTGNSTAKHLHYQETSGGTDYNDFKKPIMLGFGGY